MPSSTLTTSSLTAASATSSSSSSGQSCACPYTVSPVLFFASPNSHVAQFQTHRCPDAAKIKPKMLYSSSKEALKRKLVGFSAEIQATDFEELDYDEIYQKVSAGGTK